MIYESGVWKRELKKELRLFRHLLSKTDFSEESSFSDDINLKIEKFFFVSAFIIRKLNEANKLSDELNATSTPALKYERINRNEILDYMNNHRIDEFYDLDNGKKSSIGIKTLCNSLIHSFIFSAVFGEEVSDGKEELLGILINSDYSKDNALYYIDLDDFFKMIEEVANDYIMSGTYDRSTGKSTKSRNLPSS
jgi:hypothetical protein